MSGCSAVGDFDGDGAPDIVLANRTTFFTLMNTTTTYGAATRPRPPRPTASPATPGINSFGAAGADTLSGGAGGDLIYGNKGADRLVGGTGATPCSAASSDAVFGLAAPIRFMATNKRHPSWRPWRRQLVRRPERRCPLRAAGQRPVDGNRGDDTLYGEDGVDTFVISKGDDCVMDFAAAEDKIETADVTPSPRPWRAAIWC